MIAEGIAGLGALKTAFDMAKGLKDIDDTVRRNTAVIELSEKILAAREAQSILLDRVSALEKEVASFETWDAEKKRYKLTELCPGVTAYSLKEGMEDGEPPHHICGSCYQDRHKSVLQAEFWQPMRCEVLVCHDCGAVLYVKGHPDPEHKALRPPAYRPK